MKSPQESIEYLARSEHRIEVLQAICNTPRTREEIRELTEASRVTAGRIIADLEERGWIVRSGTEYESTSSGRFVTKEFTRLQENLKAFAELPSVVEWFPDGQPEFDLSRLADATVTTANEGDLIAPIRRGLNHIERATHLRAVGNGISKEFAEALREAVEADQTVIMLGPPEMIEAARDDPDLLTDMRTILESDQGTLLRYDVDFDLPVMQIGDDAVALCDGDHQAMVETENEAVYEWAEDYFESLRRQATRVSPTELKLDAAAAKD